MRLLARVGSTKTAITALTGITALYMGLVVFGNITDYETNHAFVQHVFAMDTTFGSPNTSWRAITDPTVVTVAYVLIILWEAVTALVLLAGLVAWLRRRDETARRLSSAGWVMQVLLFGGGFIAIGGEWFVMWQSKDWNGLTPAFQNFVVAALGLILLHASRRD
jgi:predicted small integral membrane protein